MGYTYNKLKGRIVEKYGTRQQFASVLGISTTSLSKKLNGLTGFNQKDICVWCKLLDIPETDVGLYFFT